MSHKQKSMGAEQSARWCRLNGFGAAHPDPESDLGYRGRTLDRGRLTNLDTPRWDVYWADPEDNQGVILATDDAVVALEDQA